MWLCKKRFLSQEFTHNVYINTFPSLIFPPGWTPTSSFLSIFRERSPKCQFCMHTWTVRKSALENDVAFSYKSFFKEVNINFNDIYFINELSEFCIAYEQSRVSKNFAGNIFYFNLLIRKLYILCMYCAQSLPESTAMGFLCSSYKPDMSNLAQSKSSCLLSVLTSSTTTPEIEHILHLDSVDVEQSK